MESYEYKPFGEETIKNASGTAISGTAYANPFMFTAPRKDYEEGSDLYHFRTRQYSPITGRFISHDSIGDWGSAMNLGSGVAYCNNNPINYIDPFGLEDEIPAWAKGLLQEGKSKHKWVNKYEKKCTQGYPRPKGSVKDYWVMFFSGTWEVSKVFFEIGLGFTPIGPLLDVIDFGTACQSGDGTEIVFAGIGFFPAGDVTKLRKLRRLSRLKNGAAARRRLRQFRGRKGLGRRRSNRLAKDSATGNLALPKEQLEKLRKHDKKARLKAEKKARRKGKKQGCSPLDELKRQNPNVRTDVEKVLEEMAADPGNKMKRAQLRDNFHKAKKGGNTPGATQSNAIDRKNGDVYDGQGNRVGNILNPGGK